MGGTVWCLQEAPSYPVGTTRPRFGRFHFASLSGCGSDLISCTSSAGSRDSNLDVRLDEKLILTRDRMRDVSMAATGGGAFILKPVPSPFVSVSGSVLPITLRREGSNHGDCGFGIQRNRRVARSGRPSKAMRAAATGALGAAPGHGNARADGDAFLRAGNGLERVRAGYADFGPIPSDDKLRSMRASIVDHLLPNFPELRVGCDRW